MPRDDDIGACIFCVLRQKKSEEVLPASRCVWCSLFFFSKQIDLAIISIAVSEGSGPSPFEGAFLLLFPSFVVVDVKQDVYRMNR
jgi:hypothetical protein